MRILALVTDAYGGRGGIAQYNRDLFGALSAMAEVEAVEVLPRMAQAGAKPPAKVRQRPPPPGRIAYAAAALWRAAGPAPHTVICGHINLAPLAAAVARLTGARLVMQLHGVEAWERPSRAKRRAVEAADLVLCVSRYTRARLLAWADVAPERAVVLSNTVSEAFTPGDRRAARARFGLSAGPVLLTVGRLSPDERYKGQDAVIGCLPDLPEAVYLVAGEGEDRPRLEALAARLGVAGRVRFLGHVGGEDLADLYRAADLFVMPSTGEGFGIVFLEAMACGTPALGLAAAGAADALGDGELGEALAPGGDLRQAIAGRLAAPRPDPGALAEAVRARFGRAAFERRAADTFSLPRA